MFKTAEVNTMIDTLDTRTLPTNPSGRHPRPFRTFYYMSANDKETDWSRVSRSCTRVSALKAAVGNMLISMTWTVFVSPTLPAREARLRWCACEYHTT